MKIVVAVAKEILVNDASTDNIEQLLICKDTSGMTSQARAILTEALEVQCICIVCHSHNIVTEAALDAFILSLSLRTVNVLFRAR